MQSCRHSRHRMARQASGRLQPPACAQVGGVGVREQLYIWGGECRSKQLTTPKHAGSRVPHPHAGPTIALSAASNKSGNTHHAVPNPKNKKREPSVVRPQKLSPSPGRELPPFPPLERWISPHGFVKRDPFACHSGKSGCDRDGGRSRSVVDTQPVQDGGDVPLNCASTYD